MWRLLWLVHLWLQCHLEQGYRTQELVKHPKQSHQLFVNQARDIEYSHSRVYKQFKISLPISGIFADIKTKIIQSYVWFWFVIYSTGNTDLVFFTQPRSPYCHWDRCLRLPHNPAERVVQQVNTAAFLTITKVSG